MSLDDLIQRAPKALLHDHLDGGVRPHTVIELAREFGYKDLPTTDVDDLATWFNRGAKRNDLVLYLETFAHTVGVMQDRDAIERVAFECALDLAADGVVYAEVRFAPELSTEKGMTLDEVMDAVLDGFRRGSAGTDLTIYSIVSAMRTAARSLEIAELAVRFRDADAAKVFIGAENKLFALSGSSVIAAPYHGRDGRVVGVVGVIGPTRLNYARVVPMVDFTAQSLTRLMA